jgi:hypothetical protein
MKSNKQRRIEIKERRLERAAKLAAQLSGQDARHLVAGARLAGMEPADREVLARYNNTYGLLPTFYLDLAFTCRDCGIEEVWTAKQQKWWYEVIHGHIDSTAVRCRACRRAYREQRQPANAGEGANLLREQTQRLRALTAANPNGEALAEIDAALESKWWSLRVVAIETMGRWGGARQVERLEALVAGRAGHGYWSWERVAADAAAKALARGKQVT